MTAVTRCVAAGTLAAFAFSGVALAQQIDPGQSHHGALTPEDIVQPPAPPPAPATGHARMMAERKAADERLDQLLAAMEAAPQAGKLDAVMAVVRELAARQKACHAMMMSADGMQGMPPKDK
jgi:hypothetical protein